MCAARATRWRWRRTPLSSSCSGPPSPSRSRSTAITTTTAMRPRVRSSIIATASPIMDELFWRAVLGASMLGAVAGPIGSFVLWRRMAYLGASLAEMALLGAALGLILGIDPLLGVLATSVMAAMLLARPWSLSAG